MRHVGRHASMDIGSNTIRLLVADAGPCESFKKLYSSQKITRLAQRSHETGLLSEEAMERTIAGAGELLAGAAHLRPFFVSAAATHAVRRAKNGPEFAGRFRQRLGFPLNVIEWEKEAELSLKGAGTVVGMKNPILLFDIGGGSTEFIYRGADARVRAVGTELGVVRLAETFIKHAPLVMEEYRNLEAYLKAELAKTALELSPEKPFLLVGTAGTITSIAAIIYNVRSYSPERVNNKILPRKAVADLLGEIGRLTLGERSKITTLENGREDLIIPGIALALAVMDAFAVEYITVSDAGLREGIMSAAVEGSIPSELLSQQKGKIS
ncbi:MAG: Ppx/GppA family phosphatase [Nitrospinae bacterium]|nr:Ppx/GppA family phosphatase [Nitrospinota bacterium]